MQELLFSDSIQTSMFSWRIPIYQHFSKCRSKLREQNKQHWLILQPYITRLFTDYKIILMICISQEIREIYYSSHQKRPNVPIIIEIFIRISREKLIRYIFIEWLTNYEKIHQEAMPVQTSDPTFLRLADGSVKSRSIFKCHLTSLSFSSDHFGCMWRWYSFIQF